MRTFWRIAVCVGGSGKALISLALALLFLPGQNYIALAVCLSIALVGLGAIAAQSPRYSSVNLRIGVILGNVVIVIPLLLYVLLLPQALMANVEAGNWKTVGYISAMFLLTLGTIVEIAGLIALGRIYRREARERRQQRRAQRAASHARDPADPTEAALAAASNADPADDVSIDEQLDLDTFDRAGGSTVIGDPTARPPARGRP